MTPMYSRPDPGAQWTPLSWLCRSFIIPSAWSTLPLLVHLEFSCAYFMICCERYLFQVPFPDSPKPGGSSPPSTVSVVVNSDNTTITGFFTYACVHSKSFIDWLTLSKLNLFVKRLNKRQLCPIFQVNITQLESGWDNTRTRFFQMHNYIPLL